MLFIVMHCIHCLIFILQTKYTFSYILLLFPSHKPYTFLYFFPNPLFLFSIISHFYINQPFSAKNITKSIHFLISTEKTPISMAPATNTSVSSFPNM